MAAIKNAYEITAPTDTGILGLDPTELDGTRRCRCRDRTSVATDKHAARSCFAWVGC
jgi:hypothetical protein